MTRIAKLYAAALSSPRTAISFREFERLLVAFGFQWVRTDGSHRQYVHPKVSRSLPIQPSAKDAKPYQVRQFLDMVREHGLSMDE